MIHMRNMRLALGSLLVVALVGVLGGCCRYDAELHATLEKLREGRSLEDSLTWAFATMGTSVVFTGFALAIGVGTWAFSALKFQADMGVLLAFMFLFNMLGAMLVMPALTALLFRSRKAGQIKLSDPCPYPPGVNE